jgi:transcriptional regulator with XRE-family HTH domain
MPRQTRITDAEKAEYYAGFPARLRRLMEQNGTSQAALGEAVGVTRQAISYYQLGQSSPTWKGLCAIADFFNVTLDYLCGRSDFMKEENGNIPASCLGLSEKSIETLQYLYKQKLAHGIEGQGQLDILKVLNLLVMHDSARMIGQDDFGFPIYDDDKQAQVITAIRDYLKLSIEDGEDYIILSDGSLEPLSNVSQIANPSSDGATAEELYLDSHGRIVKGIGTVNSKDINSQVFAKRIIKSVDKLKDSIKPERESD